MAVNAFLPPHTFRLCLQASVRLDYSKFLLYLAQFFFFQIWGAPHPGALIKRKKDQTEAQSAAKKIKQVSNVTTSVMKLLFFVGECEI